MVLSTVYGTSNLMANACHVRTRRGCGGGGLLDANDLEMRRKRTLLRNVYKRARCGTAISLNHHCLHSFSYCSTTGGPLVDVRTTLSGPTRIGNAVRVSYIRGLLTALCRCSLRTDNALSFST